MDQGQVCDLRVSQLCFPAVQFCHPVPVKLVKPTRPIYLNVKMHLAIDLAARVMFSMCCTESIRPQCVKSAIGCYMVMKDRLLVTLC